jgi:hypothetical protein
MVNGESSWKEIADFIYEGMSGQTKISLEEKDYEVINKRLLEISKDVGLDEVLPFSKKVMNLNILDKANDFSLLEKFPIFWKKVYGLSIDLVAVESRQAISG